MNSRLIDFGNGPGYDNVLFRFDSSNKFGATIFNSNPSSNMWANKINLNEWYFISVVLKKTNLSVYYNGTLVGNAYANIPKNIIRSSNYAGKSNWNMDLPNVNAKFDDLKFFNKALNLTEI